MNYKSNFISKRSSNYRAIFFKNHKGLFFGKLYFCSYCGTPLTAKKTTVDHLVPVNGVKNEGILRYVLKRLKILDINDVKNLIPACEHCNKRKGSKTGIWLIKGFTGKSQIFQLVLWVLTIILAIAVFVILS